MRTTIDIPDDLYRQAEAQAEVRGMPLGDLLEEGLRQVLNASLVSRENSRRVNFPLIHSKNPGTLTSEDVRNAKIEMDRLEDLHRVGIV